MIAIWKRKGTTEWQINNAFLDYSNYYSRRLLRRDMDHLDIKCIITPDDTSI